MSITADNIVSISESNGLSPVIDLTITDDVINELAIRYADLPDVADSENYRFVQDGINDIRSYRAKVRDKSKALKSDALEWQKKVTAEEKRIDGLLRNILDPMSEHKRIYDDKVEAEKAAKKQAEEIRKNNIMERINGIRLELTGATGKPSIYISDAVARVEGIDTSESFDEFEGQAEEVKSDILLGLQRLLFTTQTQEIADKKRAEEQARIDKETAELERKRKEQEEQQAAARKEQEDELAAIRKQQEIEIAARRKQLEEQEAAVRRQEAEQRKAREKEAADKAQAERDAENKEKVAASYCAAVEAAVEAIATIIDNIDAQESGRVVADSIVDSIQDGGIPYIKFTV